MRHIILTIFILFISNNVTASKRCLSGKDFSEKEVEKIIEENKQFDNEFNQLRKLVYENPNDADLKEKLDKKMLRFNEIMKAQEIHEKIELPQNLQDCSEFSITNDQFTKLIEKWQIIARRYPANKDVVYNNKLLDTMIFEIAGA